MSTSTSPPDQFKDEVKAIETKAVNQTVTQLRSLAAGAAGGLCAVVVGHPFDLVKVRLQTAEKGIYSGAMDVVRKTVAREGLARVGSSVIYSCSSQCKSNIDARIDVGSVCWCVRSACGCDSNV